MIASAISASCHSKKKRTAVTETDGEGVLEEEDEPVAEEEANALEVDGRARHQLAGLMTVVEAEREPHQVRVEALAHVHLDGQRLLSRDQPPPGHQDGAERRRGRRSIQMKSHSFAGS